MTLNGAIMQLVEMCENSMMPNLFKPYFDKVIETISECAEPSEIPHWITCSERMPEEGSWAIWCSNKGSIQVARWKIDAWDHFYPDQGFFELEDAVAWMPLPEPYAERRTDG